MYTIETSMFNVFFFAPVPIPRPRQVLTYILILILMPRALASGFNASEEANGFSSFAHRQHAACVQYLKYTTTLSP